MRQNNASSSSNTANLVVPTVTYIWIVIIFHRNTQKSEMVLVEEPKCKTALQTITYNYYETIATDVLRLILQKLGQIILSINFLLTLLKKWKEIGYWDE